jgi:hypothetical protein
VFQFLKRRFDNGEYIILMLVATTDLTTLVGAICLIELHDIQPPSKQTRFALECMQHVIRSIMKIGVAATRFRARLGRRTLASHRRREP